MYMIYTCFRFYYLYIFLFTQFSEYLADIFLISRILLFCDISEQTLYDIDICILNAQNFLFHYFLFSCY